MEVIMQGLNKATLIGNLGNDPRRVKKDDFSITKFSLATNEIWKDKDGNKHERTEWHNIVAFGKLSQICCEHLKKGKQVYIEGRIQNSEWESEAGDKKSKSEIVASKMIMLGSKALVN
jgi:single-strand DNA-binding protein